MQSESHRMLRSLGTRVDVPSLGRRPELDCSKTSRYFQAESERQSLSIASLRRWPAANIAPIITKTEDRNKHAIRPSFRRTGHSEKCFSNLWIIYSLVFSGHRFQHLSAQRKHVECRRKHDFNEYSTPEVSAVRVLWLVWVLALWVLW